jgi:hypothetical protein
MVQVQFVDFEIPVLTVDFAAGMRTRLVSIDETLEFSMKLPYAVPPDRAYITMRIDDKNRKAVYVGRVYYSKLALRLWDYIPQVQEGDWFTLHLTALVTNYTDAPYHFNLRLDVNAPPSGGQVVVTPTTGQAMFTDFVIAVKSVVELHQPLQYNFMVYQSAQLYAEDTRTGVPNNAYDITRLQSESKITTKLPSGKILIVVRVLDSFGAWSNFT